jgi:dipeptidyl aminopeptidase/acylaminoacyl peptidase
MQADRIGMEKRVIVRKPEKVLSYLILMVLVVAPRLSVAQERRPITLQDLQTLGHNYISYLQISPDGRRIVYTTRGNAAEGEDPESNLWIVDAHPGSIPRQLGHGFLPHWAPDGEHLAYYTPDSRNRQLWVVDVRTGQTRQITHIKDGIQTSQFTYLNGWWWDPWWFSWSPDGSRLVFGSLAAKEGAQSSVVPPENPAVPGADPKRGLPLILTTTTPYDWTMHGVYAGSAANPRDPSAKVSPREASQIFIVNVKTGQIEQLTHDEDNYFNPQWSPDGKSIVCTSTEGALDYTSFKRANLYLIGVDSKTKRAVTKGDGLKRLPSWSPDGKWIAYLGAEQLFGVQRLYVVSATATDTPKDLTSQFGELDGLLHGIFHFVWSPDSRSILVNNEGLSKVDINGLHSKRMVSTEAIMDWETFSISGTGVLVWKQSDERSQGLIEMMEANATTPSLIADTNPQMKDWTIGAQELVQWKNSRGDQLEGVLIKPAGYKEGHKYPLIVDCYPALGQTIHAFYGDTMFGSQALASRGYAVFFPVSRAPHVWTTVVKNEAFMQAVKGPDGWDVMVDDIMSGVDELIGRGIVDPDRMGLTGFSNGGGVADYLVTATSRFRCAVSIAAVAPDWLSQFFFPADGGSPASVVEWYGKNTTPWTDLEGWTKMSAVYRLPKVTTPMLLADGDNDIGFLPGMIEMYQGLRYLGKDVILLRYEGQGHGFEGAAMADFWRRENEFFDRYLNPAKVTPGLEELLEESTR